MPGRLVADHDPLAAGERWRAGPGYRVEILRLPMRRGLLGEARAYLIAAGGEHLLVDTGPGDERATAAFDEQLSSAGVRPGMIGLAVVTHAHPDHIGSVRRLQALGVRVLSSRVEAEHHARRVGDVAGYGQALGTWLAARGVPRDEASAWAASIAGRYAGAAFAPDAFLDEGAVVTVGPLHLLASLTPGHTPGHLVLALRGRGAIFVGDHVLPSLAPNVGEAPDTDPDPLPTYLASLRRLGRQPGVVGLPGHGDPFDVAPRARAIVAHQEARGRQILAAVEDGCADAWAVTARLWSAAAWSTFTPYLRANAVRTVSAHLARLEARGALRREPGTAIRFRIAPQPRRRRARRTA